MWNILIVVHHLCGTYYINIKTMVGTYCVSFSHLKDESMCHLNKHLKQETGGLNCFKELPYDAFTFDVKSMLNENLGGILGGTQC